MKIFTTEQIRRADEYTIKNEPVSSIDLMERAARAIAGWLTNRYSPGINFRIFSGPGNNGGDGLAVARLLSQKGFRSEIYLMKSKSGLSPDTSVNLERLRKMNVEPVVISSPEQLPDISQDDVVIDALFGTGLNRPLEGFAAMLIDFLNKSKAEIISVDIPSGLFGDDNRENPGSSVIKASYTLSFQFPKLSFMFEENHKFTGTWEILPIGLHRDFINNEDTPCYFIDGKMIKAILKPRKKFSHKGNFGHCLLISGSYSRMGAAVLAARSCLRAGAGLLTVHVPARGCDIIQISVPEAMTSIDKSETYFSSPPALDMYAAIGVGPATGTLPATADALYKLLNSVKVPIVVDADAINIISQNREWIELIPESSVLTPHPGEFDRLAGKRGTGYERFITQIEMAKKYKINIVLKGAYTSVATPSGSCYFNSTGNPGMATAGSGDVLTGIILSLLGQGYEPSDASLAGVYLHGLAGDLAAEGDSQESIIAGDISDKLGKAFKTLKT